MQKIILFDGICNLCNRWVQFVLKHDRKRLFLFASLQGASAQEILKRHILPPNMKESVILVDKEKCYTGSTAALKIVRELDGIWKWGYAFMVVPKFIRDGIYRFVANNRYRWFGKRDNCMIPAPEWQDRFLS